MTEADGDWIRICPSCGTPNASQQLRCGCGVLLFGVDLVRELPAETLAANPRPADDQLDIPKPAAASITCPHDDCGQPNAVGAERCLYCNRLLQLGADPASANIMQPGWVQLPADLGQRYRIVKSLVARGMEAEILLVEPLPGQPRPAERLIAKVYRQGILPSAEVQQCIARVDPAHCVKVHETGISEGRAWELMEYCPLGSLRDHLTDQPMPVTRIHEVLAELVGAIQAVHDVQLIHRDLKPGNVLVRTLQPLDLVLTDFGSSSMTNASQHFTQMAQTLQYSAPETLSGVLDTKADYWALGMMTLEMALGRHPFDGLSNPVILYQLTTRPIDVSAVADLRLRQLATGLLARDPKQRWGGDEVARWLAGDRNLPDVVAMRPTVSPEQAFTVLDERCTTTEQLAVAWSRHWQAGLIDIRSDHLLRWISDVQNDQNATRFLLHLRHDSGLDAEHQLLRFIARMAPGIPPTWRGHSLNLSSILEAANRALQGDSRAGEDLHEIYMGRVLEVYGAAGNARAAELAERWRVMVLDFQSACSELAAAFEKLNPAQGAAASYDALVYGGRSNAWTRPPLAQIHPQLLAAAYDPAWTERLRQHVRHTFDRLTLEGARLDPLGDVGSMGAPQLIASAALLPHIRKRLAANQQHQQEQSRQQAETRSQLRMQLRAKRAEIQFQAHNLSWLMVAYGADQLLACLDEHDRLAEQIHAAAADDDDWLQLRQRMMRGEPLLRRIRDACELMSQRSVINNAWLSQNVLTASLFILAALAFFLGVRVVILAALLAVGLLSWRLGPIWKAMKTVRDLSTRLSNRRL